MCRCCFCLFLSFFSVFDDDANTLFKSLSLFPIFLISLFSFVSLLLSPHATTTTLSISIIALLVGMHASESCLLVPTKNIRFSGILMIYIGICFKLFFTFSVNSPGRAVIHTLYTTYT